MRWPSLGKWWPSFSPRMSADSDSFAKELATHLNALAMEGMDLSLLIDGANHRNLYISNTALSRAVTLISGICALMVTTGMTIRDDRDKRVTGRRPEKILELLTHSPDGGLTAAETFIEDGMADYLLDGNTLIHPNQVGTATPTGLTRYISATAYTTIAGANRRVMFATAPVQLLNNELRISSMQNEHVRTWFKKAPKPGIHFNYIAEQALALGPDEKRQVEERTKKMMQEGGLVVTFGAESKNVDSTPQNEAMGALREFQTQEVARFYGLPLPLMSWALGQWTRGINEQVMRMAWRTCIAPHLGRFLAPLRLRLLLRGERFAPDPTWFVRGDAAAVAELVNALQGDAQRNPLASRDELRWISGLPRDVDGQIINTIKEAADNATQTGNTNSAA